jgi:hypothetical protein
MTTMTSPNDWGNLDNIEGNKPIQIPDNAAMRVQVRKGGPILVCRQEPEHDLDGFLMKEGETCVFTWSMSYRYIWVKTEPSAVSALLYIGGETIPV